MLSSGSELLESGLSSFGINASRHAPLMEYLNLLQKWNKRFNLTAIRTEREMVVKHVLDSLSIKRFFIDKQRVCDVGTGAGLPGIPLALCLPDTQFLLLDSNGKKTRFLHQVKNHLDLKNVEIVEARTEDFRPPQRFDAVTSRAFSDLNTLCLKTQHLLAVHGEWFAMKSQLLEQETAVLDDQFFVEHIEPIDVPFLEESRMLAVLRPTHPRQTALKPTEPNINEPRTTELGATEKAK